jgi:hypothetical protein
MVSTSHPSASATRIAFPVRPATPSVVAASAAQLLELALLVIAGALLLMSMVLPYWQITLHAPQYPKGLVVQAYLFELAGDVSEVDGLNHYIGMMKLDDAATIERQIALVAIPLMALLAVASVWLRGVWRVLARLPIVIFPLVFIADLFAWLYYAGHSLDPHAALSSSIKPFTPSILGAGGIGQFTTEAEFLAGFALAAFAALIVLIVSLIPGDRSDVAR